MRFGLYLPNQGPFADLRVLSALSREAEEAGWDGVFIWDAIVPIAEHAAEVRDALDGSHDAADPFIAMTAIASATERIRFGALVTPVSRLRPEVFAHQTATLDRYSGGRLIVGIGLGNPLEQFSAFGLPTDSRERAQITDEFLEVVTELWTGRTVEHKGAHFTATGVSLSPTPAQTPRIPIWVGADTRNRAPRRRAARWDGFAPASDDWPEGVISVEDYESMVREIMAMRTSDAAYDVVLIGNLSATSPTVESLPAYEAAGVTWLLVQALTIGDARDRIHRMPQK
jgi:alkanesulfonate monooxygenase SsuD/methylene tetrahydromethanopterin reductase-like flavin-dependent oxidoreductase (luciferase family)